jgi:amino acid transporter
LTATSSLTATPTVTPKSLANPAYTMTLQTNSEFVASIIAINVATIMITFMCVCCVGCCAFIVYKRHKEDERPRHLALRSPIQAWAAPAV